MENIISLDNVSYYYKVYDESGKRTFHAGVKNVTLDIQKGSFVALVGHNGCGKSTLAKLLNGLLIPQQGKGKVLVNGLDTADDKNLFEVRKTVGMVFQNPDNQMVASIVEEDVAFGPENLGIPQKEIVERVTKSLQKVGMLEYAKRTPTRLSGGQKQRIAIAGALAIQPQVLVLDESTAMLDPMGRKEVLNVAHQLNKEGMTVVLITHFMEEVLDADVVVVMNNGEIVAKGTPMQIFDNADVVDKVGLRLPRTVELAARLHAQGFDVDRHCTDARLLGEKICQLLQKN